MNWKTFLAPSENVWKKSATWLRTPEKNSNALHFILFFPLVTGIIFISKQEKLTRERKSGGWLNRSLFENEHSSRFGLPSKQVMPWNHNHHLADFAFSRFRLHFWYTHERDKRASQRALDRSFYGNFNMVFGSFRNFISFFVSLCLNAVKSIFYSTNTTFFQFLTNQLETAILLALRVAMHT